ncbi:MAG TPA: hypothetical protein VFN09_08515 [Rhodanobacteraceae bacterium]|nr:hypothetical protein [Rhodanobacteraceae bacterium]
MSDFIDLEGRHYRADQLSALSEANALHRRKLALDEANAANALKAAKSATRAAWAAAIAAAASAIASALPLWLR